jgi:hypothetical protein
MKKPSLLLLSLLSLFSTSALRSDTLVSGGSTYDTNIVPFNSETSFNLALTGGDITSLAVFHEYQIGAKGASNQDFTSSFSFGPVPYYAVGTIGVATGFAIVIDGVTYSQASPLFPTTGTTPADGSSFTITLDLTPISGTNILNTTQNSTASGLFAVTGSINAFIENGTYTFPQPGGTDYTATFSGYADFNGSYMTSGLPATPQPLLTETYTYSSTVVPEPGTGFGTVAVLGCLWLARGIRRRRISDASRS